MTHWSHPGTSVETAASGAGLWERHNYGPPLLVHGRNLFHAGGMPARVKAWFDGTGLFVGGAMALFVFALLAVLLELQSPEWVFWTGRQVTGTEQGGIITYRWQGQTYSLDAPGYGSAKSVSVWLNPAGPSDGHLNNPIDRVISASLVGVPVLAGVALLGAGLTRKYRWERRQLRQGLPPPGLDPEFADRHLRDLRH